MAIFWQITGDIRFAFRHYRATPVGTAFVLSVLTVAMSLLTGFLSLWSEIALKPHGGFADAKRLVTISDTADDPNLPLPPLPLLLIEDRRQITTSMHIRVHRCTGESPKSHHSRQLGRTTRLCCTVQVIRSLEIHPKLCGRAEGCRKIQSRFCSDAALASNELVQPRASPTELLREGGLSYTARLQELFPQDFTRMKRVFWFSCHS
jgi:hypothetical protein